MAEPIRGGFGAAWLGGRFTMIGADDRKGSLGSANAVSRDGSAVTEAYSPSLIGPLAVAADGKTIVGWGGGETSSVSFLLRLDQVWVCSNNRSQLVGFPGAMISYVSRGATPGLCPADRPIEP